jgi:predicted small lipoprotein YifL
VATGRSRRCHPADIARRLAPVLVAVVALAGCGSRPDAELPPAAHVSGAAERRLQAGVDGGVARLDPRRRVVELGGAETDAGVGPYAIASDGGNYLYVTDVKLGAVLVFRARPELRLIRRLALPGGPTDIVYDARRRRLWTVLTEASELVGLRVSARTTVLDRYSTVRRPTRVLLADGRVIVTNGRERQSLDPRR